MELTRRTFLTAVGAAVLAAATASVSGCTTRTPAAVSIATGEAGGTYIRFGELLRDAMLARGAGELRVLETHGSVQNLELLRGGEADLALSLTDAAAGASDLVAIGRVYQNSLQCIVRADGPVASATELASARFSLGAPGSGAAVTAERVLTALGIPGALGRAEHRTLHESIDALERGELDAFFWSGGLPTPEIVALHERIGVRMLDLADAVDDLDAAHPLEYQAVTVPSGVYGAAGEVTTIGVSNLLLARADLDDAMAARLVDVLIEDARSLVPNGSLGVQYLTAATLIDTSPLGLHPAAERRYRERYR